MPQFTSVTRDIWITCLTNYQFFFNFTMINYTQKTQSIITACMQLRGVIWRCNTIIKNKVERRYRANTCSIRLSQHQVFNVLTAKLSAQGKIGLTYMIRLVKGFWMRIIIVACSCACPSGQYQSAACTSTTDRVCTGKILTLMSVSI